MELQEFKIKILPLRGKLYNYARKLCDDPLDAEDAIQEVYIKLWKLRDELDQYNSTEAFAIRITHNLGMDMWRTKKTTAASIERVQLQDYKANAHENKSEAKY